MGATSAHFTDAELACRHCGVNGCTEELVAALEQFRAAAGNVPVIVDDAYRCAAHNAAVGGAVHSQHEEGNAADVRIEGMSAAALEAVARRCPLIKGIGRADFQDYLHVDVRELQARWCYTIDGREVDYYAAPQ